VIQSVRSIISSCYCMLSIQLLKQPF